MAKSSDKRHVYGGIVAPEELKTPKESERTTSSSDEWKSGIENEVKRIRDELIKQNRDYLDSMYNIGEENMDSSMRRMFQSWTDGISSSKSEISAVANANEAKWSALAEWKNETTESIASVSGRVDANSASIESLTTWRGETTESIAGITQRVDENSASITSLTQWKGESAESIAGITQKVDENTANITLLTQWIGESESGDLSSTINTYIEQYIDGEKGTAQIISAVEGTYQKISDMDGYVTNNYLNTSINQYINSESGKAAIVSAASGKFITQDDIGSYATTSALASVSQRVDNNSSSIDAVANYTFNVGTKEYKGMAGLKSYVDLTDARIDLISSYEFTYNGTTYTGMSGLKSYSGRIAEDKASAYAELFAAVTDEYGEVTAASIVAAVNDDGSSVKLSADRIALNGDTYFTATYDRYDFGVIQTIDDGSGSDYESRYALKISTLDFTRGSRPVALKLGSEGRMSLEARGGIYQEATAGYLTLAARDAIRIRGDADYNWVENYSDYYPANDDYVFCSDGIWYNGKCILSI